MDRTRTRNVFVWNRVAATNWADSFHREPEGFGCSPGAARPGSLLGSSPPSHPDAARAASSEGSPVSLRRPRPCVFRPPPLEVAPDLPAKTVPKICGLELSAPPSREAPGGRGRPRLLSAREGHGRPPPRPRLRPAAPLKDRRACEILRTATSAWILKTSLARCRRDY